MNKAITHIEIIFENLDYYSKRFVTSIILMIWRSFLRRIILCIIPGGIRRAVSDERAEDIKWRQFCLWQYMGIGEQIC